MSFTRFVSETKIISVALFWGGRFPSRIGFFVVFVDWDSVECCKLT